MRTDHVRVSSDARGCRLDGVVRPLHQSANDVTQQAATLSALRLQAGQQRREGWLTASEQRGRSEAG